MHNVSSAILRTHSWQTTVYIFNNESGSYTGRRRKEIRSRKSKKDRQYNDYGKSTKIQTMVDKKIHGKL